MSITYEGLRSHRRHYPRHRSQPLTGLCNALLDPTTGQDDNGGQPLGACDMCLTVFTERQRRTYMSKPRQEGDT